MPRGVRKVVGAGAIVAQVQTIGKSLGELLKLLEKEGSTIGADQFEKVFGFLRATLAKVEEQARKDRVIISAGEFSWDAPLAAAPAVHYAAPIVPQTQPAAPAALPVAPPRPEWKRPTGRISANSPNTEQAGKLTHAALESPLLKGAELDPETGITLLDK
jgi:hypothetical protein